MQQIEQDYVPYGPEWEKELIQFNKPALINLLRKAYEWKKQAVDVMPDFQKIGQLLNIPLGQNVSHQIIPKIEELQARLAAKDAGKESEGKAADIYDSIYMEVVELVEKDNIQCEAYKETAEKLQRMFTITRKK